MITYISIAFCLPFLKLVPTRKEVQIPTQHVVTKTSERMKEENVDGRKCMLLLYSKILCIYKHLMIAYFEKVFFKKINATRYSNSVEFSFPNLLVESCSIPVFLAESLPLEHGTFSCCLVSENQ